MNIHMYHVNLSTCQLVKNPHSSVPHWPHLQLHQGWTLEDYGRIHSYNINGLHTQSMWLKILSTLLRINCFSANGSGKHHFSSNVIGEVNHTSCPPPAPPAWSDSYDCMIIITTIRWISLFLFLLFSMERHLNCRGWVVELIGEDGEDGEDGGCWWWRKLMRIKSDGHHDYHTI